MNQMTDLKKRAVLSDVTNVCNMRHAKSAKISNIPDPRILMPSMEDQFEGRCCLSLYQCQQ